jgi:transposase
MEQVRSWVGLDVHRQRSRAYVIDRESGEVSARRLEGPPTGCVVDFLASLPGPVRAAYEAGPTGFGLARAARLRGLDVRVCAPGLIPRKPADRVKTDAKDAERLARLLLAGELDFVYVPTETEQQLRDLVRCREDLRTDLMRARQRLLSLLLRRDLRYPGREGTWTRAHRLWLEGLIFDDDASRVVHADYLAAYLALETRRGALDAQIAHEAEHGIYSATVARLRCFRGIDTLTAVGLAAEIGTFARFAKPHQLADYVGLVPSEHTSDTRRRQGAITKAGPAHARRLLVEATGHYRHRPVIGAALAKRQSGQDPRVCEVAWRCQRRLARRFAHLTDTRGRPGQLAVVACARELTMFLWEAATL